MPSRPRVPLLAALLAAALLTSACDNSEHIVDPGPPSGFEAEVSAPISAMLEGPATAQNDLTLGTGGFTTLPFPTIFRDSLSGDFDDLTITALLLQSESPEGHTIAFTHIGENVPVPGEYDVSALGGRFVICGPERGCDADSLFDGSTFSASYAIAAEDSLKNFQVSGGTVTLETVTDERVAGGFELEADAYSALSQDDLRSFRDGDVPPADSLVPPTPTFVELDDALTVEGTFEAEHIEPGR